MDKSEADSVFVLKVVLFLIFGTIWIRFGTADSSFALPVGLLLGLYFAHHEHFKIDRKIEFVVLIVSAILSYIFPIGFILVV